MADSPQCVICGAAILRAVAAVSWQHIFRAVRKRNGQTSTPFLTGIGKGPHAYGDPRFAAPSDPDQRSDEGSYTLTALDEFRALIGNRFELDPGFPFHEACWQLLKAMVHPQEVPVEFLYFICYSFSIRDEHWLDWGHSYGGLASQKPVDHYPWEQRRIYGLITRVLGMSKLSPLHTSTQNPYEIPELQEALENKHVEAVEGEGTASHVFREHEDCFSKLPMELCEEILIPLPSKDVANLRMASRSFARITLSQSFWKSRFRSGFEREHIFEISGTRRPEYVSRDSQRDWRVLYHQTNPSVLPSRGLANRRRIWISCRPLVDILKSRPLDTTESTGLEDAREWSWRGVGGEAALNSPHWVFPSTPCKVFKERAVQLPSEITEILVSTVTFYDKVYITGLKIVAQDQSNTVLGYILPGKEASLDLRSEDGEPGKLTGFIAAVDANGIRGLKATLPDGRISEWAGQGDEIPVTLRLCTDKPITHIKGGFDGFKMVWLSIPSKHTDDDETSPHVPLRTTALWYPDVPPKNHYLHDSSFAGRALPFTQHRPLIRVMFGGPNGSYLKYLTRISVTVSRGFVAGLEFEYEAPGSPIGRMRACRSTTGADDSVKIPFAIDGPGGEILTGMQVKGDFWPSASPGSQNGAVIALAVATNRERKFTFEPSAIPRVGLPSGLRLPKKPKKIEIEPGTTITGIYVMHDSRIGMISLGPISESLCA